MSSETASPEQTYRALFEAGPDAVLIIDAVSQRVLEANPAALRLYGYSRAEICGLTAADLSAEPDATRAYIAAKQAGRQPHPERSVLRMHRKKSGAVFPVEITSGLVTFAGGRRLGTFVRDVSERMRAEREREKLTERLEQASRTLEAVLDAIPDVIGLQDDRHYIIRYNRAGYRFLGLTPEHCRGRKCYELIGNEGPCAECATSVAYRTKQPAAVVRRFGEIERWLDIRAYPILNDAGEVTRVVEHLRDITEERHLRERLQQAEKLETIGQLAGGIAHDFNNLLVPIMGHMDLMLADLAEGDPRRDACQTVLEAAERAGRLVRKLLAFGRKQLLDIRPCTIDELLRELLGLMRRTIRENVQIECELEAGESHVAADRTQLEQVVMNLIVNARDAMPDGGRLRITSGTLRCGEAMATAIGELPPGDYAVLSVADTGQGMPPEVVDRIFDPFFTTKARDRGTGLGLATVYGIVKQHGGGLEVDSTPGRGTTFRILLPLAADGVDEPGRPAASGHQRGHGECIVVVEDDALVRDLVCRILDRHGYRVQTFQSPQQALDAIGRAAEAPELLLTDVVLPGMNGRALLEQLRRSHPELRVLYMSGYPGAVLDEQGIDQAEIAFIQKPFAVDTLLARVAAVLDA